MNKAQKEIELAKLKDEARELKVLKAIYNKAAEDVNKNLVITNGKIEVLLADIDNLDEGTRSILRSQIYHKNFQEGISRQLNGFLNELNSKQYKSIDEYLNACYKTGFVGAAYELADQGIPLIMPLDQKKIVKAIKIDSKISKPLYTKLGEDVDVLKKRIANNISRGIAFSDSYENIARNIRNDSKVGFNKAMRIARTEGHRVHVESAFDAMKEAQSKGADIVKQWNAQLDGKTRPHHRQLDGQLRELDEPFEIDGKEVMYPGAFGRPEEDINCRCVIHQRAKWALDDEELETLKERAAYYGLDKTKDFDDFKKKYLKVPEEVAPVTKNPLDFTEDENKALEWYVSGEGMWVNQYLRGKGDFGSLSKTETELLQLLTNATDRELPKDINKLYRSVDAEAIFGDLDWSEWEALEGSLFYGLKENKAKAQSIINRAKNKTITEKGFMSTTKEYDVAAEWGDFTGAERPIVLELDVPKGTKGADLKKFDVEGEEQFEVLLSKNTKYTVRDISAKDGQIYIKAELEVPKQNADIRIDNVKTPKTMKTQYKDVDPMNEYDFYSEEQELFRLESIKELAGYNDEQAKETLAALCGTREEYLKNADAGFIGTDSGWFSGGDRAIRKLATPEAEQKAKVIHEYIMNAPNYEGAIYRGATITKEQLNNLEVGGIFEENGAIASWTTQDSVAKLFAEARGEQFDKVPIILELEQSTHCTPAAHLSIFGNEENEILVSNMLNDKFIITEISENNGITRIKLKERGN